jgi:two-component system, cell cycle response regulator DivK
MRAEPVLIVDDNPTNLKLVRTLLAGDEYEIRTASDGREALDVLTKFHPRLILMDIQMPGMNGLELTRLLKSDSRTRDIIVVAITAYAIPGDEARMLKAGCSGYVTKPIDTRTLPSTVKGHLGARQAAKPTTQAGDYHDLLAECRNTFLVDGEEESGELLRNLTKGFDPETAQRVSHRWAGIAGMLGFTEISRKARGIESFVAACGQPHQQSLAMTHAANCTSRLRSDLLNILLMFSDGLQGTCEIPMLPPVVQQVLLEKRFAVIDFEDAEAARIAGALAHARAHSHVFVDVPENGALKLCHAAIVNVSQGQSVFSWMHNDVLTVRSRPVLFVGSAETILRREPGIPEGRCDFLLGPWDADELILRAFRLLSLDSDRDQDRRPSLNNLPAPRQVLQGFFI